MAFLKKRQKKFFCFFPALEKGTGLDIKHNVHLNTLFALPFPVQSDERHILAKKKAAKRINNLTMIFMKSSLRYSAGLLDNYFREILALR
jgi:hypothetical protein